MINPIGIQKMCVKRPAIYGLKKWLKLSCKIQLTVDFEQRYHTIQIRVLEYKVCSSGASRFEISNRAEGVDFFKQDE